MDIAALIAQMREDGDYRTLGTNPGMQFGSMAAPFLGATLLPEVPQERNEYREERIKFRTIIASDNTRYSPPVKKNGDLLGSMLVELGESDIARSLNGQVYDALVRLLGRGADPEAVASLLGWNNTALLQALLEFNERQRWQAIVDGEVDITINGTTKTIQYLSPAGARFDAGGDWSDDTYDPFDDIGAGIQQLEDQGYSVVRAISSRKVQSLLSRNAKMAQRAGRIVLAGGDLSVQSRVTVSRDEINTQLTAEGWAPLETYDRRYHTESGTGRYLKDDVLVLIGETGESVELDMDETEDEPRFSVDNVLGYVGVGVPTGESAPGRVIRNWFHDDKPPRVDGQGWQTSLSVITAPGAIVVIRAIQ